MPHTLGTLFDTLLTDELTYHEIQKVLDAHSIEDIKTVVGPFYEQGLLHRACAAPERSGSRRVLMAFFEDARLRPLFADPTYLNKLRLTPVEVMRWHRRDGVADMHLCILDDIVKEFKVYA